MIIDIHTHLFSPEFSADVTKLMSDDHMALMNAQGNYTMASHDKLLIDMNTNNIDKAVAMGFAWYDESFCQNQNTYLASLNTITDNRIIGFGSIPLKPIFNKPDNTDFIKQYVEQIKKHGLFGIGEIAFYKTGLINETVTYLDAVLQSAEEFELPVCLHVNEPVGHMYTGKYYPNFEKLLEIIEKHQTVKLLLSHWGGGLLFYEHMPEIKKTLKNCWYDTAASPFLYDEKIYSSAVEMIGAEKICMGTDFPLLSYGRYKDSIENNIQDKTDREKVLRKNAEIFLGI